MSPDDYVKNCVSCKSGTCENIQPVTELVSFVQNTKATLKGIIRFLATPSIQDSIQDRSIEISVLSRLKSSIKNTVSNYFFVFTR